MGIRNDWKVSLHFSALSNFKAGFDPCLAQVLQSYRVLLYPEGFLVLLTSCPTMSSETRTLPHRLIISRAFKLVDDSHTRVACKKHGQSSDSASVELASMLCVNRGSSSGHSSGCKSALPDVALKS